MDQMSIYKLIAALDWADKFQYAASDEQERALLRPPVKVRSLILSATDEKIVTWLEAALSNRMPGRPEMQHRVPSWRALLQDPELPGEVRRLVGLVPAESTDDLGKALDKVTHRGYTADK